MEDAEIESSRPTAVEEKTPKMIERRNQLHKNACRYEGSRETRDGRIFTVGNNESPSQESHDSWGGVEDETTSVIISCREAGASDSELWPETIGEHEPHFK